MAEYVAGVECAVQRKARVSVFNSLLCFVFVVFGFCSSFFLVELYGAE